MLACVKIKECHVKVLVAVKRVPDYKAVIRLKPDGSGIETANLKMSINPFDEIAVEAAVQLKEQGIATDILVVSMGNEASQEILRGALAMGADRAILIKTDEAVQPLQAATYLKMVVEEEKPTLVILGKQAIDTDNNQVGQMLAGLLQWPQATFASNIECHPDSVRVTREIDGGLETLLLKLPAVITTDLRLNEPRYLSLPNIMKAKAKPLVVKEASTLAPTLPSKLRCLSMASPPKRSAGVKLASVDELVLRLKDEARVIS